MQDVGSLSVHGRWDSVFSGLRLKNYDKLGMVVGPYVLVLCMHSTTFKKINYICVANVL